MKRLVTLSFVLFFAFCTAVYAQDKRVSGRVVSSDDGTTLPGVSVVVKGTTIGTQTDIDGNFSLSVPANATTLVFTAVGFVSQEQNIGTRTVFNVRLVSDAVSLSEVTVTGYGVPQKRDIGAASSRVDGKQIENLPLQSFDRALQGRAAGVQVTSQSGQPGGAINVRIRGIGSISAGNTPLYIVDGVQVTPGGVSTQSSSNALASINPNDIESMEILKDAAASSIYGAAAANGVVLITTKRGAAGKTKVNFSSQVGINQNFQRYDIMNASQFARLKFTAFENRGLNTALAVAEYGDPNNPNLPTTDWVDLITQNGITQLYDLSLSGGDEKTTFFISGSYNNQEGQFIQSFFKRGTVRLNLGHKISEKFQVNTNISFNASRRFGTIADGNFVNGIQQAYLTRPDIPAFQPDGTFTQSPKIAAGYNIVQGIMEEVRTSNAIQSVSNLSLSYKITNNLTLTGFVGVDFLDNRDDNQRPASIPVFAGSGGTSLVRNDRSLDVNTNLTANYNKTFGTRHNLNILAGAEFKEQEFESASATGSGFPNPLFRSLSNSSPLAVAGFFTGYKRAGVFGQVKYDLDNKYYLTGTLRYDGSSRFGANQQYGLFGGGSATWRIKQENFLQNFTKLSDLKLRVSYGVVGNDQIGDFASRALFGAGGSYLNQNGIRPSQLGNADLTWEEAATTNLGLDYGFFDNRITGSIDVYRRINSKLLLNNPLPGDSGFGGISQNVGKVQNQGIELQINTVNLDTRFGLKWNTSFNITAQENKVLELTSGNNKIGETIVVGRPLDLIFTNRWAGVNPADGRPMWFDANGNYTYNLVAADASVQGNRLPKFFGGFNNTISFKGLTLDVLFQYQYGNKAFSVDNQIFDFGGFTANTNQFAYILDRMWTTPGQITDVPRPLHEIAHANNANGFASSLQTGSTRYLFDASYIRLKNATLSYSLPTSLVNRIGGGLRSIAFSVTGFNLLTFTKYPGLDPEVPIGFNQLGNNPQARTILGGIQIGF